MSKRIGIWLQAGLQPICLVTEHVLYYTSIISCASNTIDGSKIYVPRIMQDLYVRRCILVLVRGVRSRIRM